MASLEKSLNHSMKVELSLVTRFSEIVWTADSTEMGGDDSMTSYVNVWRRSDSSSKLSVYREAAYYLFEQDQYVFGHHVKAPASFI